MYPLESIHLTSPDFSQNFSLCRYIIPPNEFAHYDPYLGQSSAHFYLRNLSENEIDLIFSELSKAAA
jgi:hypothetical protein